MNFLKSVFRKSKLKRHGKKKSGKSGKGEENLQENHFEDHMDKEEAKFAGGASRSRTSSFHSLKSECGDNSSAKSDTHSATEENEKVTELEDDSESLKWRKRGNERYTSAGKPGINLDLKKSRLSEAIEFYQKSFDTADIETELASSAKNLGTANMRLAAVQQVSDIDLFRTRFCYTEAVKYFDKARQSGLLCMPGEWNGKVEHTLTICIDDAFSIYNGATYRKRVAGYENVINCLSDSAHKAQGYLKIARLLFMDAVSCLNEHDYKQALDDLGECYRPIEECKRLTVGESEQQNEANILTEDCFLQTCAAESMQAIDIADKLLQNLLNEDEKLDMTPVYEVLDWYKKAILLTREKEIEMEAIANSRIGVVYDKVTLQSAKAHTYFMRSMELARSLQPRNFASEEWFKVATAFLKKQQDERVQQEDEKWNKERETYVKQLEKELKALKEADSKSSEELLRHVYKTHPPKKSGQKLENPEALGKLDRAGLKGVFKKALLHYHPDKQKDHGELWLVLSEEITKCLTRKYEGYKFGD